MDRKTTAIILLLLIAILGGAYWSFGAPKKQESIAPPSDISDAMDIAKPLEEIPLVVTESIKRSDAKERYTIDVEYPSVVLATDPQTARLASDVIKGEITRMIDDFLVDARDTANAENIPPEVTSEFTVRHKATLLTTSIISIRLDRSTYIRGAAHPDSGVRTIIYDIREHALLSTADLFTAGGDYLGYLSGFTRDHLKNIFSDQSIEEFGNFVVPGTEPNVENFREVLVTPSGLTVFFNTYQVAPYARGVVTVDVPYSVVESRLTSTVKSAIREANASSTIASEPSILMQD